MTRRNYETKPNYVLFFSHLMGDDKDEMSKQGHVSLDQTPPWLATPGGADPGAQGLDRGPTG